jgi:hypothetical protein
MKFTRIASLIAIAVVLSVGLFAGSADAVLDSIRVVSPDSGKVRGIDSLITVEVHLNAALVDSGNVSAFVWLAKKSDATGKTEIGDNTNSAVEDTIGFAQGDTSVVVGGPGASFTTGGTFVAMRATVDKTDMAAAVALTRGSAARRAILGDADSVSIANGPTVAFGSSFIVTFFYKVPPTINGTDQTTAPRQTVEQGVTAFGTSFDKLARGSSTSPNGFSPPQAAKRGWATAIDGDRPTQVISVTTVTPRGGVSVTGFDDVDPITALAQVSATALGVGDTVKIDYNLGSAAVDIAHGGLTLSAKLAGKVISLGQLNSVVDSIFVIIAEDQYPNLSAASQYGDIAFFLADPAGNLGDTNKDATTPLGITSAAAFVLDATRPKIDSAAGDTLLPSGPDTLSDGTLHPAVAGKSPAYPRDENVITYKLAEALSNLAITFDSATDANDRTYNIKSQGNGVATPYSLTDVALLANNTRTVDLTYTAASEPNKNVIINAVNAGASVAAFTTGASPLKTGLYTLKLKGTDVAGNVGVEKAIENVYVDVDDFKFIDPFPTMASFGPKTAARLDTIEETTAVVTFQLSEPVDSLMVTYKGLTGPDANNTRTRKGTGVELTNTTKIWEFPVDSLKDLTKYELTIIARDLAGNYTLAGPDTFMYDTSFVVPLIHNFVITASQKGLASPLLAGAEVTLTIKANAKIDSSRNAVTFKGDAVLTAAGGSGVTFKGDGVTDQGDGVALLSGKNWPAGVRTVTMKNTASVDTIKITVLDEGSKGGPYKGNLDSAIVYNPEAYTKIIVKADAAVQGTAFPVDVILADKFNNVRVLDNRYVSISANKLGVEVPVGDLYIKKGMGSFMAKSNWVGEGLVFTVKDLLSANTGTVVHGMSAAIAVTASNGGPVVPPGDVLDAPNTLVAEDYMGADGLGDQGGFVMLTFDLSEDHASVDAYRIYRTMKVTQGLNAAGDAIVPLAAAEDAWVAWAKIDAIPGETVGRAVVATLDNVATFWGVAAERGNETTADDPIAPADETAATKIAFASAEAVSTPYELMASTMVESKKAALPTDRIATLTPEAFAYIAQGIAPQMKSVDGLVSLSPIVSTEEPVRAIDNIAPEAISYLRVMDTPNDAGSSVTVTWTRSESDRLLPRLAANAVGNGAVADQVAGVKGYQILRKAGDGEYTLVGKALGGETSFADVTALNGVRYSYQVRPYDEDNVTEAAIERTAMAIRNNAVDKDGQPILGLFGMDNKVGFDDFFIFADYFGMTAADEAFEPAFDLAPSVGLPTVGFDDFFVFSDYFGRSIEAAGKVIPMMAGLNTDARLYLDASAELPQVGDEVVIDVSLADFAELQGYGLSVNYDAEMLEFVKAVTVNDLLGEGELATPQVVSQTDGEVAIAAYGEAVSEGDLGLSLVFRTKTEIEDTFVEVTESEVRDGNFSVNQVALPAPIQIQTRPEQFALANNYPNPFNPATTIKYALPEAASVRLEVFNVVGQVVRTLVADHQNAGRYVVQWDASDDSGHSLSSGIYFYRLQAGGEFLEVKKMLLLK